MSTLICLIRHGQTEWNKHLLIQGTIDNPLNETGISQAHNTSKLLKKINIDWDTLISSPLQRALSTMQIIKEDLNLHLPIIKDKNVIEREFGELEGCKVCEESYSRMYKENVEGLEKLNDLQNRAYNAILDISRQYPNSNILITSHSQFIKGFLTKVIPEFDFKFVIKNTSLNFILVDNDKIQVLAYNITDENINTITNKIKR